MVDSRFFALTFGVESPIGQEVQQRRVAVVLQFSPLCVTDAHTFFDIHRSTHTFFGVRKECVHT